MPKVEFLCKAVYMHISKIEEKIFWNTLYKTDGQVVTEHVDLFTPEKKKKSQEKTKETIDSFFLLYITMDASKPRKE